MQNHLMEIYFSVNPVLSRERSERKESADKIAVYQSF